MGDFILCIYFNMEVNSFQSSVYSPIAWLRTVDCQLNPNFKKARYIRLPTKFVVILNNIEYFIANGCPDAVVCVNDSVALGVYKAAKKVGISIPEDVAVVGFGNLDSGQLVTPPLTTVDIPIEIMCYSVIDLLVKLIDEVTVSEKVIQFDGELIIRDSV